MLVNTLVINFTNMNFFSNVPSLIISVLNIYNNKINDKAFLAYLYFFSNYMNETKPFIISNYYLYKNSTHYYTLKNMLIHDYTFTYHLKNISNIFVYNFYKYFNIYNVLVIITTLLLGIYTFNIYRLSII